MLLSDRQPRRALATEQRWVVLFFFAYGCEIICLKSALRNRLGRCIVETIA